MFSLGTIYSINNHLPSYSKSRSCSRVCACSLLYLCLSSNRLLGCPDGRRSFGGFFSHIIIRVFSPCVWLVRAVLGWRVVSQRCGRQRAGCKIERNWWSLNDRGAPVSDWKWAKKKGITKWFISQLRERRLNIRFLPFLASELMWFITQTLKWMKFLLHSFRRLF